MGIHAIRMPDIGEGIAEAEIAEWLVKPGDLLLEDQPMVAVMTDKATVEIPSPVAGKVVWLAGEPGDVLAVGAEMIRLEVEGPGNVTGDAPAAEAAPAAAPAAEAAPAAPAEPAPAAAPASAIPGNHAIRMPDIGEGIAEAEIAEWLVQPGDLLTEDQPMVAVMTDKATVEIPSPVAGKVAWLAGAPGDVIAVGAELIRLEVEGPGNVTGDAAPAAPAKPAASAPAPKPEAKPQPKPQPAKAEAKPAAAASSAPLRPESEKPIAAPSVRARARDAGVDLRFVRGSGPAGRITHDDLDAFIATGGIPPSSGPQADTSVEEIRVIGVRRKMASRMEEANRATHITIVEEVDATAVEDLRAKLNAKAGKGGARLNPLPFIARAIVIAVREQPMLNAHYDADAGIIHRFGGVHIGIAAQTPTGLMVPVLRHAEALDLHAASAEIARLAQAAKEGTAKRDELTGSTITITSLGSLGAIATTPILNMPEITIVGINRMAVRPFWNGTAFEPRKMMNISCSFDHRVVDGWSAAVFVARLKELLETPALLFVENRDA